MPDRTRLGFPYPLAIDQVSEGASDIQSLAEAVDLFFTEDFVTVLPAGAPRGRIVNLIAEPGHGVIWTMISNGAEGWHYLGGPPMHDEDPSYQDVPGGGWTPIQPVMFLPVALHFRSSLWDIGVSCHMTCTNPDQNGVCFMSPSMGDTMPWDTQRSFMSQIGFQAPGGLVAIETSGERWVRTPTWVSANAVQPAIYRPGTSGSYQIGRKRLWLRPVYIGLPGAAGPPIPPPQRPPLPDIPPWNEGDPWPPPGYEMDPGA